MWPKILKNSPKGAGPKRFLAKKSGQKKVFWEKTPLLRVF